MLVGEVTAILVIRSAKHVHRELTSFLEGVVCALHYCPAGKAIWRYTCTLHAQQIEHIIKYIIIQCFATYPDTDQHTSDFGDSAFSSMERRDMAGIDCLLYEYRHPDQFHPHQDLNTGYSLS